MAEALANATLSGIEAHSAGVHPGEDVNPMALEAMRELGYDLSKHRTKHLSTFIHMKAKWMENWDIPDPAQGDIEGFRRVRDMLADRIARLRPALAARQDEPEQPEHQH